MTTSTSGEPPVSEDIVGEEAKKKAEEFVEQEEGAVRHLTGRTDVLVAVVAIAMSLYHLYAAYAIIPAHILRATHLGFVLFLLYLLFPAVRSQRDRIRWHDVVLALLGVASIAYLLFDFDEFIERAVEPTRLDLVFGVILILLVLEGVRRTSGLILAGVVTAFIVYAFAGPWIPAPFTHRGYDLERLVGQLYMTLEGIFGTALDVSATFIILFTIYGAVLAYSGAGEFFIDFSLAVTGGKRAAAGRSIVLASFLLGGPSGSGVATTVTIGSVAWPMLAKAGYPRNAAGGLLAAGGLGAIISPAGAGRGRLPHRRVPEDLVPRRDLDGHHPHLPLLPGPLLDGGARRAPARRQGGRPQAKAGAVAHDQAARVPLHLARRHRRFHALGLQPHHRRVLGHPPRRRALLPAQGDGAPLLAERRPAPQDAHGHGAPGGLGWRAGGGGHLRRGWHHRRES